MKEQIDKARREERYSRCECGYGCLEKGLS